MTGKASELRINEVLRFVHTGCGALRCGAVQRHNAARRNAPGVNTPSLINWSEANIQNFYQFNYINYYLF